MHSIQCEVANLATYFEVIRIPPNEFFEWSGVKFKIVQTIHIYNGFAIVPSFGLIFEVDGQKVFLTTDTQFCPEQIKDFYKMADIIFHDCETSPFESGVHAPYDKLKGLPAETKAKMWLYHYQPGELPDANADGFRGFVTRGQIFDFADTSTLG